MITLKFQVDFDVFKTRMDCLANEVIPYMRVTWQEIADWAFATIKAYTPPPRHPKSTNIRELWGVTHNVRGAIEEFVIENTYENKQVLIWFEGGTKPHVIPVGKCGFLHFKLDDGTDVYTKRDIKHPGTPRYEMVAQTRRETEIKIAQYTEATFAMCDKILGTRP